MFNSNNKYYFIGSIFFICILFFILISIICYQNHILNDYMVFQELFNNNFNNLLNSFNNLENNFNIVQNKINNLSESLVKKNEEIKILQNNFLEYDKLTTIINDERDAKFLAKINKEREAAIELEVQRKTMILSTIVFVVLVILFKKN